MVYTSVILSMQPRKVVPTKPKPNKAALEALRVAGEKMQEAIAAAGTTEDELMEDFKRDRRERRMQKDSAS